jgi:hypothetical protein
MVLEKYLNIFIIIYLNDIIIYSNGTENHKRQVKQVLKLDKADMILNIKKCEFFA